MAHYSIIRIERDGLSDPQWQEYFALLTQLKDRFGSQALVDNWQGHKRRLTATIEEYPDYFHSVLLEDGRMAGWVSSRLRGRSSEGAVSFFKADANYERISEGFGRTAAGEVLWMLQAQRQSETTTMTDRGDVSDMIRMWGAQLLNRIDRYRLYRRKANHAEIRRWIAEGTANNPDLSVRFFEIIPDEYADRYCELYRQFVLDMPSERADETRIFFDLDALRANDRLRQRVNSRLITCALFDRDGLMIAHANCYLNADSPEDVYQAMTGVVPEYRGRGLAKWLKAAIFVKVGEEYPASKTFFSEMRAVNDPILAINREMGYESEGHGHELRVELSALRKFVAGA